MLISFSRKSINLPVKTQQTAGFETYPTNSLHRIADCIKKCTWSPIVFKGGYKDGKKLDDGYRDSLNFYSSSFLTFDFDCGHYQLEDALADFCEYQHVIGTTHSHRPEHHKFRVVIPWTTEITSAAVYVYNMAEEYRWWDCDQKCKDAGRHFFRCKEIISVQTEGETQDVLPVPPLARQDPFAKSRAYAKMGILGFFTKRCMSRVIPEREKNNACFKMGCEFARCGTDYEDAVMQVLESPTYRLGVSAKLLREIERAIWSGYLTEGAVTGGYKSRRT